MYINGMLAEDDDDRLRLDTDHRVFSVKSFPHLKISHLLPQFRIVVLSPRRSQFHSRFKSAVSRESFSSLGNGEKTTDPARNSSAASPVSPFVERKPVNSIVTSLDDRSSTENFTIDGRDSIIDAFPSPPVDQNGRNSRNSSLTDEIVAKNNTDETPASRNATSCDARRIPVVNRKTRNNQVSMREMEHILAINRRLSCSKIPRWSVSTDFEILRARREIDKAPIVDNDPELYAPAFRNISMFKRSYELMEKILKVYVYKEGEKPIFHSPHLTGIYSTEGWFMKNMGESRRFRTENPLKAHLFYIPLSSKILRDKLFIPTSHSRKNIVQFLKNYVSEIASKHPFWNRTGGADHFLAACHDWAASETGLAMGSTIRALCNSDLAGLYELGKDLTLPTANIIDRGNPELGIGGKPAKERPILAFFAGKLHGDLRPRLLDYWGNGDPDMKVFGPLKRRARRYNATMSYSEYMKRSKFCICARGYEVHSPRVVEAILKGCVPVIVSDNYVPPFFEVLDWDKFSVAIKEEDVPRLKEILIAIAASRYEDLSLAVSKVRRHFLWHRSPQSFDAFHMTLHSVWLSRVYDFRARG
ncbi:putative glycosyltransferase At3g07620 [Wolffia australiana]